MTERQSPNEGLAKRQNEDTQRAIEAPPALTRIDVFVDLEGIGIPRNVSRSIAKLQALASHLPLALMNIGYEIGTASAFASGKHQGSRMKEALSGVCTAHGWNLTWSSGIADTALTSAAMSRLHQGTLPNAILLVTNDHDFLGLVRILKNSGRFVFVVGPAVSKRFHAVVDRVEKLRDLLAGSTHHE